MLFTAKFSKLEKRYGEKAAFYIAHSSSFDKTSILFFEPKDENLLQLLNTLCEHNERLSDYEFKVINADAVTGENNVLSRNPNVEHGIVIYTNCDEGAGISSKYYVVTAEMTSGAAVEE